MTDAGRQTRRIVRNGLVNGLVRGFVVFEGERIVAVGEEPDASHWIRAGDAVLDAEGLWILPAFTDSHIHVQGIAHGRRQADLHGARRMEELADRLTASAGGGAGTWLLGTGWDETLLGGLPDRTVLDRFFPDRPVFLSRRCLHIGAANTLALEASGMGLNDPVGAGAADRLPDKTLSGILREEAMGLVTAHIPAATTAERERQVGQVLEDLARQGIASVSSNDSIGPGLAAWEIYRSLLGRKEASTVYPEIYWDAPLGAVDAVREAGLTSFDDRCDPQGVSGVPGLRMGGIKFITDGSLGGRTAYMQHPYTDHDAGDPDHRGLLRLSQQEIQEGMALCAEAGLRVCLHAIGDGAAHVVLDALEHAGRTQAIRRPRIIHSQFVTEEDRARYARLGVVADVQPLFAVSDLPLRERVREAFGYGYAWRRFLACGVRMAMGSDAPVESPNPILGVRAARYRGGDHADVPNWDGERLDLGTVLRAYAEGGAYAQGADRYRGRLQPGHRADAIVIDPTLFTPADPADPDSYVDRPGLRPYVTVLRGAPVQEEAFETVRQVTSRTF